MRSGLFLASVAILADAAVASMVLVAQAMSPATADAGVGLTGWASALTSSGVLGWLLLKGLPDKDKQLKDKDELWSKIVEGKDRQIIELTKEHAEERQKLAQMYLAEANANRSSGQTIADKHSEAFLVGLDRQHKHCLKHLDLHNFHGSPRTPADDKPEDLRP